MLKILLKTYMFQYTILDRIKRPFVIYKDIFANKYCLDPRHGLSKKKSLIISLPQSGVCLMENILKEFSMQHVRVNLDKNNIEDYRFLSDQDRMSFSRMYDNYSFSFADSFKWISEGQFVYNSLKYDDNLYCLLRDSDYLVYLLKRNLKSSLVSHAIQKQKENMIFTNDNTKLMNMYITLPYYKEVIETTKLMLPWFENKTFNEIEYETLVGQNGKDKQYQTYMQLFEDFNIKRLEMDDVINTCVGDVVNWEEYWTPEIEKWFVDNCGEINETLGY